MQLRLLSAVTLRVRFWVANVETLGLAGAIAVFFAFGLLHAFAVPTLVPVDERGPR